jgi:hypothetical protein
MNLAIDVITKLLIIPEKDVDEYDVMMLAEETCELVNNQSFFFFILSILSSFFFSSLCISLGCYRIIFQMPSACGATTPF